MRFLSSLALLLLPLFALGQTHTDRLLTQLKNPRSDYVFVIAHRADWRSAPENSLAAIQGAIRLGADMVELDVQKTKDGKFVLMHDRTIDRTTEKKGEVKNFAWEELKQIRLKDASGKISSEHICLLEDALRLCKGKILVNIDKGDRHIAAILPILKATGTERQVVIKGRHSAEKVTALLGKNPDVLYMPIFDLDRANAPEEISRFLKARPSVAVELVFSKKDFPEISFARELPQLGSRPWVNTLWDSLAGGRTDEKAMRDPDANWGWVLSQGATMIQTDRPAELIQYLQKKNRRTLK